jgi:peroxiredoxin
MRTGGLHTKLLMGMLLSFPFFGFSQAQSSLNLSKVMKIAVWSPERQANISIAKKEGLTAVVLFSPECPMCINYTQPLNTLKQQYDDRLQVIGIVPGKTYSDDVIKGFTASYRLNFPLYVDKKMSLTRYLKGEVTPEVYLFDNNGQLVYRGAIDNWLVDLGQKKQKPDQHYLLNAITQTLSGELVRLPFVKAQGCILNDY